MNQEIDSFFVLLQESLQNKSFVKLTLSANKMATPDLKNIYAKTIQIKNENYLSFTYRYKTKDIVKNYSFSEAIDLLKTYINAHNFTIVNLLTTNFDFQLIINKKGIASVKKSKSTHNQQIDQTHNKQKHRFIRPESPFLYGLKITDKDGSVYKATQDKYKQINHFIELLSPLILQLRPKSLLNVVDMGSGKGYLTFALYDYLVNNLQLKADVIGIEFRADLVGICNEIAENSAFEKLHFIKGSILDYQGVKPNILIALHACDTATDDAIYQGINAKADLIVVAPCCHKQIRKEIEKNKAKNELDFITKHGILLERQAEMVTDGIRALILEYFGYSVKIQQFISGEHTPKNVMITAVRKDLRDENLYLRKPEILEKIKSTKVFFGIETHHLESLLTL